MVLVSGNWRVAIAGLAVSLAIFLVLFFAVIKPDNNAANQAIKTGLQQSQQALNQAQKGISSAGAQGSASAGQAAQKQVSKAQKLTACLATAGTDVSKMQSCQALYTP